MPLNARQQQLYQFRVSLYSPTAIEFQSAGDSNAMADTMKDQGYEPNPVAVMVPCYFQSAAEVAAPIPVGLQSESNMFTYYVFSFAADVLIDNTWVIQFTMLGHPNDLDYFFVADVPKTTVKSGLRDVNRTQVFAKRGDKPNGIV